MEFIIVAILLFVAVVIVSDSIKNREEYFANKDRADRYYRAVDDLDKWCRHELPEIEVIAKYLIATGEGQGMNAGSPVGKEACTISGLREQIIRMKNNETI
jgi:hypothetical protein